MNKVDRLIEQVLKFTNGEAGLSITTNQSPLGGITIVLDREDPDDITLAKSIAFSLSRKLDAEAEKINEELAPELEPEPVDPEDEENE